MPSVDLCLACSSSLPPRRRPVKPVNPAAGTSKLPFVDDDVFVTECCGRAICPTCISSNPRLARYNPCIQCLGGVDVMNARSLASEPNAPSRKPHGSRMNVDGGIHDEDVFALGDDDDESEGEDENVIEGSGCHSPPPAYTEVPDATTQTLSQTEATVGSDQSTESLDESPPEVEGPRQYFIQPSDTLLGISLKFGIDGRLLCKLNSLPPSTLRTTPHLLHTRTVLTLPACSRKLATSPTFSQTEPSNNSRKDQEARRARGRAVSRFQGVTKETDYAVTRAYIALAESSTGVTGPSNHGKEMKVDSRTAREPDGVDERAIDQYMDDEEWEAKERREGRDVHIPRFPLSPSNLHTNDRGQKPHVAQGKLFSRGWKWR